ncbi:Transcription factor, MADS-box [Cynara cardunculus var. scolymus]|uniref:Transcription factor, MADS-box n=1 Tax=Cynara cardunculus var. scolymus TaxID=59895 RepID=A0A103Y0X6_CYNCS|nr:Transcription factor, MADS-box [Cynara cardunculus var. scolymus]
MMPKKTKGCQKIEIVKITDDKSLAVTFSKRRSGIFRKLSELGTLCGAKTAIVVFSPIGKPYSFGHPDVETIVDRYLVTSLFVESRPNANTEALTRQPADMLGHLEVQKKVGKELDEIKKARERSYWWGAPIETLGFEELEKLKVALLELKKDRGKQAERLMLEAANPTPTIPLSELGKFCGAETAIVVFSPTGKPYSFGHPDVEMIVDRYLVNSHFVEFHPNANTEALTRQLADMLGHLKV